ncbi:MAG: BON domain-containing protein [Leptolyngbya sp. DLM2.Bin27]|nr:MAG: BON domain-containing protein [Leptolyngbya sp. DLM2.Bin27]
MLTMLEIGAAIVGLGAALLLLGRPQTRQASVVAIVAAAMVVVGFAQPAMAGAVKGNALSNDQKELNEQLQTTPQESQYQGIEYADVKGTPLSDQAITNRVESQAPKNLKISVSNGSVRLSGKVSNRDAAQAIIDDIKAIPGVHEIAYDLGLSS